MGQIPNKTSMEQSIAEMIEQKRDLYIRVSDQIWEYAETRYEEHRSAELMAEVLEQEGFTVERNAGGIPTAVVGSYGQGKPVIAILGEYDALFGLSQTKGESAHNPVEQGGNGHGCGHNLLGSGMLAAAVAVRDYIEKYKLSGTIRFYGCPAEEGGGGKGIMARNGLFDDVDAALTWHPGSINSITARSCLATCQVYFKFKGRSAHAAGSPHLGRGALDAVELMNVGANYLREHLIPEARLHYAITNSGGISPNVVQAEAEVLYKLRVPRSEQLEDMYERVCNVARGAALMTGTELEIQFDSGSSELIMNRTLEQLMFDKFTELGVPVFNGTEDQFAARIRATLTEAELNESLPVGLAHKNLSNQLEPYEPLAGTFMGSTDVGDVSWKVPTAQCAVACVALGTPFHTWQVVSQGATSMAHKGMLHAGKVIGATATELLQQPELLKRAKEEHVKQLGGRTYKCLIPKEVNPGPVKR
ncbi:M20 family metallopeptidase [Paenibacillus periandrae]|uniref:M20 family metallopeptidase n=1 Tax=Paenibacillus periandrae TaxID=1761741 RepID=UPI001F098728|nr:M20 family metallopeptidase [Paenibacillus periandrae]